MQKPMTYMHWVAVAIVISMMVAVLPFNEWAVGACILMAMGSAKGDE